MPPSAEQDVAPWSQRSRSARSCWRPGSRQRCRTRACAGRGPTTSSSRASSTRCTAPIGSAKTREPLRPGPPDLELTVTGRGRPGAGGRVARHGDRARSRGTTGRWGDASVTAQLRTPDRARKRGFACRGRCTRRRWCRRDAVRRAGCGGAERDRMRRAERTGGRSRRPVGTGSSFVGVVRTARSLLEWPRACLAGKRPSRRRRPLTLLSTAGCMLLVLTS